MKTVDPPTEQRFLFHDVDWKFYGTVLEKLDEWRVFVTYDRGNLEVMSPSRQHEVSGKLIGRMIEELTLEVGIPISSGRSTTFRREDLDRGLEPDECYWIGNEARVRGKTALDLAVDPPPDLAIEIEISRRLLDRVAVYAALGVPELWRFDGERLGLFRLGGEGPSEPCENSPSLPQLRPAEVERFLALWKTTDETSVLRAFRDWVRATLGG